MSLITLTRHNVPMSDVEHTTKEDVFFAIDRDSYAVFFTVKGSGGITETLTDALTEDTVMEMVEYEYADINTTAFNTIEEFSEYVENMIEEH